MPEEYKLYCQEHQIKYIEHTDFTEEIDRRCGHSVHDPCATRALHRPDGIRTSERMCISYATRCWKHTRPNLRILHPLPRVNEIAYDVDDNPKAYYFQQAQNGLYAREAILCDVLGITLEDVKNDILL